MRADVAILIASVTCSCGDNLDEAPSGRCLREGTDPANQTLPEFNRCNAARDFAARDTAFLTPSQTEIDRYYAYLTRLEAFGPNVNPYPPGVYSHPQLYRTPGIGGGGVAIVTTTNPKIIAAFHDLAPHSVFPSTGDLTFDRIMAGLLAPTLGTTPSMTADQLKFEIFTQPYNEELLNARLLPTSSHLPDREVIEVVPDAWWSWRDADGTGNDEATAEIHSRIGWVDCIDGCLYLHEFLAIVPPEGGQIEIQDLGGDPIGSGFDE